jgi:2-dehydro-3-deoxyphosphogluconate aldolase / (4S)-4-hydroxy-2-oxoglutarate aldolase
MDPVQARTTFETAMAEVPVIAIVRLADAAAAVPVAAAVHAGGIRLIEVTLTTDGALRSVADMRATGLAGFAVGVGSVRTPTEAATAVDAGADYLVTPTTSLEVIGVARAAGVPVISGGLTPTELDTAHQAGADYVKLFPAAGFGPRYLREVLAPLPDLRIIPTGGVDATNLAEFRSAGAVGAGIGSALVDRQTVAAGRWAEIERRTADLVAAWRG